MDENSSQWEVSLIALQKKEGICYKVTRRMTFFSVAETKIFSSLDEALEQFQEWLRR